MKRKKDFAQVEAAKHVKIFVGLKPAALTYEHQFPFVQQTSVRNEVLQRDSF